MEIKALFLKDLIVNQYENNIIISIFLMKSKMFLIFDICSSFYWATVVQINKRNK